MGFKDRMTQYIWRESVILLRNTSNIENVKGKDSTMKFQKIKI